MCGRFSQGEPSRHISDYFGAYADDDLPDGLYNVPPTETVRIIVRRDGERRLAAARWGLQPFWADGARTAPRSWINARAETAAASPVFGPALRQRRCIVPAEAFYEWDRTTTPRQPYAIGPAERGAFLALAGIWTPVRKDRPTMAILTTTPNALVAPVHDRMPVIVRPELLDAWLDPEAGLPDLQPMLGPAAEGTLAIWPVGTAVNRVTSDGPQLLDEVPLPRTLGLA